MKAKTRRRWKNTAGP